MLDQQIIFVKTITPLRTVAVFHDNPSPGAVDHRLALGVDREAAVQAGQDAAVKAHGK